MDRLDVAGRVAQQARRPERVAEVVPEPLELGRETAVEHDGAAREQRCEAGAGHASRLAHG